jgi:mono/diheme cytochrome c family protein
MILKYTKFLLIALFAIVGGFLFSMKSVPVSAFPADDDPVAAYKTKCAMCHGPKSEKAFDPAKPTDEHVQVILKGKKGEKPPFMPGFETKGMTAEQAKALAEHMKALREPPK